MEVPRNDTAANPWTFPHKVLLVSCVVVLGALAWQLSDLFMLLFGAVIVAAVLKVFAAALEQHLRVPPRWSVLTGLLILIVLLTLGIWLLGDPLAEQFERLREGLPAAREAVINWLSDRRFGRVVLDFFENGARQIGPMMTQAAGVAGMTFGALGNAALVVVMGIYLALSPRVYVNGLLRLLPVPSRPAYAKALDDCWIALSRWLLGQSVSMLFVGTATALGLWLLGVPMAFAVGAISGLLAFIPYIGAIVGGVLAVLLAFMQGPQTALYVVILVFAIQQIEGNVLMPFIQRWAVDLPPVLGISATVMFGILFGVMGVLLATPAMVVLIVLVQHLYIKGVLESQDP
jgi:predicted PurR-regulated permease PerM